MKNISSLLLAISLGTAATGTQAMHLNPRGLGQVLIYPYYSVNGGNDTYISVTNTTHQAKALKVFFREAENGQVVLDFNLYLAPFDHWASVITSNTGATAVTSPGVGVGGARLVTADNSCTAPAFPVAGVPLRPFAYNGTFPDSPADANTSITRTREGYVEILEMGVLGYWDGGSMVESGPNHFGAAAAIKHGGGGVPANCGLLRTAWNPGPNPTPGNWTLDPTRNIEAPTGGLSGYAVVINVEAGTNVSYKALAIDNFSHQAVNTNPFGLSPLAFGVTFASTPNGNGVLTTEFENSIDALSSLFMHASLTNDYVLDEGLNAATDWVITFPTKHHYVQSAIQAERAPFSSQWDGESACEAVTARYTNRSGTSPYVTYEDYGFTNAPRPTVSLPTYELCNQVNILSFNGKAALGAADRLSLTLSAGDTENFDGPDNILENGIATISFLEPNTSGNENPRVLSGTSTGNGVNTFKGLPAVGFAVQKYVNGNVGGLLSNYTGTIQHAYTQDIHSE